MRKTTILFILTLLCGGLRANDPAKVSGQVTDSGGKPLSYASVVVKERSSIGSVTDRDGRFTLCLPDGGLYTLTASYTGYEPQDVEVSGRKSEVGFRLREDAMNINTVVVTGTRTPKLLKDVPVQTRVITSADIKRVDATNIKDLLVTELPGIEFTFSMDQQVSVNLQGFGGTSVLFLVDGERMAGETLDNVDYSRLNLDNVERIEIVKGAASSLYGSNAVGGVVNIITKEAAKPWAVNLNSRYGSYNAWRNGASVSFDQGRFNSVADFQHTSQDPAFLGKSTDGDGVVTDNYQYRYRTYSVKERLRFRASDKIDIVAKGGYFFRERDLTDRYRDWTGGVRINYAIDDRNYFEAAYNFDQYDKSDFHPDAGVDERDYSNVQNTVRALYNYTFRGGHILTVGADAMSDYLMSYQFADNGSRSQVAADAFAQFDWQVAEKVGIVAGARYDYYSDKEQMNLSPKLAVIYKPGDFALRGSYGGGFRAPTLKERYMDFYMGNIFMIYGNPDLESQTSNNFTLSGEYTRGRWSATVAGYFNSVDNRITTVWDESAGDRGGMVYVNTGHVDVVGADANFALKLPCGFGAKLSYAYTKEIVAQGETNLSDTRPHSAVLRLDYGRDWKRWGFNVALSGQYKSAVDTWAIEGYNPPTYKPAHYPGYTLWNLIVTQRIWRAFTVTARVDNLFNYKTDNFTYNSPTAYGTMFSIGVSMNIEEIFR